MIPKQSTTHIKHGLFVLAGGIGLAAISGAVIFVLLSNGFGGGSLTQTVHLNFNSSLLLFAMPVVGAGAAVVGLAMTAWGVWERYLLHR